MNFGLIVSTRSFFPGHLALTAREIAERRLNAMGHTAIMISENDTQYGAVCTYEDAKKCAALFRAHKDEIDGVIVVLPNFGDEVGVTSALTLSGLSVPVLLVAADDDVDKMDLAHRRDAFCGKLSVAANFKQSGIAFTPTKLHTLPLDSDIFDEEVARFAAICRVVGGLRGARIGAIGARPDAFRTVRFSEKLLQRSGITVCVVDMSDLLARAEALDPKSAEVQESLQLVLAHGKMGTEATDEKLMKNALLLTAVKQWLTENEIDAYALQCWDSLQYHFGCAACMTMSILGEQGIPGACEMDVNGAVTMLAMRLATGTAPGYLDWNNSFTDDRDRCVCLHCSNFPTSFLGTEPKIGSLDVLGTTIDRELCFGACKGQVAPGEFTFAKVTTDDLSGKIRYYTGAGEFLADPVNTPGGVAACHVPGLQDLMQHLVRNGYEHHICMGRGTVADVLHEALTDYLGWEGYVHEG